MNIGFVSTRIAGVDGVSLEIEKIAAVLARMGHHSFYLAGELGPEAQPGTLVPECHFHHPDIVAIQQEAFGGIAESRDLYQRIAALANHIKARLYEFINAYQIDWLNTQNAQCMPMNIPLGVALRDFIDETHIPTIAHHHDFYWERDRFWVNRIPDILMTAFPADGTSYRHVVINTPMQRELYMRRKIHATYLPNVFDFRNPPPSPDDYSRSFREAFGIAPDEIVLLQPTRIIRRKNIERAVDLVHLLEKASPDRNYRLVITGYAGDEAGTYYEWLRNYTARAGINALFIGDRVGMARETRDGQRAYPLWDVYPNADFITYPSSYEGFGNALIETLYFRKPFLVNTYHVYRADIKPAGVQAIEIDEDVMPETVTAVQGLLADPTRQQAMVEHNYRVGQEHFSLEVLEDTLRALLT